MKNEEVNRRQYTNAHNTTEDRMQWRSTKGYNPQFDVLCYRLGKIHPHDHDSTLMVCYHVKDRKEQFISVSQ